MQVYITADVMKPKAQQQQQARRYSCRSALVAGLLAGVLLLRAAFLAIEAGASLCPPKTGCVDWRAGLWNWLDGGGDPTQEFMKEWKSSHTKARLLDPVVVEAAPDSLDGLIGEMGAALASDDRLDMEAVALKTMAMLLKMDQKVRSSRMQALFNRHLASLGIPKSMHCLTLRLAEEFSVNAAARSPVPLPEYASRLTDALYLHIALITDNVLAAAVAVASTVSSSADPGKLVFHIITDKKTYVPMHSWFALHSVSPAIVEVKGLHQFDWHDNAITSVMNTVEEIRKSSSDYHHCDGIEREYRRLEALKPSTFSLLNYLKIHLPEFFPELERVILLDDDVIVRKDLTELWELNLNGNVIGAVGAQGGHEDGGSVCTEKTLGDHLNFSNPVISMAPLGLHGVQCSWSWGVNVVDLDAWRSTNITETYLFWVQKNRESEFLLWKMGSLPPALIAFYGRVHAIEPLWHLSGLGWQMPEPELLEFSAVLHFSGPRKPWLEVAFPELQELWHGYLNASDSFLRGCGVVE